MMVAYPTRVDRLYAAAALLLALWGIVIGFAAGFGDDETSQWFAFFALIGVPIFAGLYLEPRKPLLGRFLVVPPGVAISVLTFWLGIPLLVGLVLLATAFLRWRADQHQRRGQSP